MPEHNDSKGSPTDRLLLLHTNSRSLSRLMRGRRRRRGRRCRAPCGATATRCCRRRAQTEERAQDVGSGIVGFRTVGRILRHRRFFRRRFLPRKHTGCRRRRVYVIEARLHHRGGCVTAIAAVGTARRRHLSTRTSSRGRQTGFHLDDTRMVVASVLRGVTRV